MLINNFCISIYNKVTILLLKIYPPAFDQVNPHIFCRFTLQIAPASAVHQGLIDEVSERIHLGRPVFEIAQFAKFRNSRNCALYGRYICIYVYIYISTLGYWGYKLSLKTIRLTVDGSISIYHGVDKPTSGQTLRPSASLLRK